MKDPKDFGPTPKRKPGFKLPDELPTSRPELLALVAASGDFPPRAARWLSPREVRALLTGAFPFESSTILAVRAPRQIKDADALLVLAADRRVNYYEEARAKKAKGKGERNATKDGDKPTPRKPTPKARRASRKAKAAEAVKAEASAEIA